MTPLQAACSPHRNLVTRALGIEDAVLLELGQHRVEPNDMYLMCSDGLSDMLADAEMLDILQNVASHPEKAARLVNLANAKGGRDNISVLLVHATGESDKRGLISRWLGK